MATLASSVYGGLEVPNGFLLTLSVCCDIHEYLFEKKLLERWFAHVGSAEADQEDALATWFG
ncbi:ribosome biogenesis protein brx1 [Moniliophthora roreri]|nr:ribosome biogenesis protein brx1 [Moniliophthora roreri]